MKYLQSQASRFVHGNRDTSNPTMAARFILGRFAGRKATGLIQRYRRGRRSAYKGNPAIAALAGVLGGLDLGKRFKAPSFKRAAAMAPAIVAAANAGNLTAARGLIERAALPMNAKEHAVWAAAAGQLAPKIRAAVTMYAALVPAADQAGPEQFAASLVASPVQLTELETQAREERAARGAAGAAKAARAEAAAERREARFTELGAAGLTALARGGRRPARRRKRRPAAREFSF